MQRKEALPHPALFLSLLASLVLQPVHAPEEQKAEYSPFVVELEGKSFDRVTFKNVGQASFADSAAFEAIAESVAFAISSEPEIHADVLYSEAQTDPAQHLACETRHIYVDIWSTDASWDYSLWSGCDEEAQFAKSTVSIGDQDLLAVSEALAQDIVEKLNAANAENCFRRTC